MMSANSANSMRGWSPAGFLARVRTHLPQDARIYQIAFQATLAHDGRRRARLHAQAGADAAVLRCRIATQAFWVERLGLRNVGGLSPVITCLGLSLLLRADSWWVHPLAAAIAMSAKFTVRIGGKHIFNPANLGVIVALIALPAPGCRRASGGTTLRMRCGSWPSADSSRQRARRWDISWCFLAA
jgi:hypothetical protein